MADTADACWATEETFWGDRRVRLTVGPTNEALSVGLWIKSVHAVVFSGERVLLVREYDAQWHFPGGRGEKNETPLETLAREMQEEAGAALMPNPCLFAAVRVEFPDEPPLDNIPYTAYYTAEIGELKTDFSREMRSLAAIADADALLTPLGRVLLREALKVRQA